VSLLWIALALRPSGRPKPQKVIPSKAERRTAARAAAWDIHKYGLWFCAVVVVGFAAIAASMPVEAGLRAVGASEDVQMLVSLGVALLLLVVGWAFLLRTAVRSFRRDFS
jgi:hypothetical protein